VNTEGDVAPISSTRQLSFPQRRADKDFGIDDIARGTLRVGNDLVENIGKLEFTYAPILSRLPSVG
jgi:hypothetical protein